MITAALCIMYLIGCEGCTSTSSPPDIPNITDVTDFGRQPRWSPDGQLILFGGDTTGQTGLWLWDLENDPVLFHDSLPPHNWDYCWSPDGASIAFTSPGEAGSDSSGIWVVSVEERTAHRIFDRGRDVSWYFDGSALAARVDLPVNGVPGIYRVELPSGESSLIVAGGHKPVCSPGENLVAYTNDENNGRLRVYGYADTSVAVSGRGARQWIWSTDGSVLTYVIYDYLNPDPTLRMTGELWRIRVSPPDFQADSLTRWAAYPAPDFTGDNIAFMRSSSGAWAGLWIYSMSGGEFRIAQYVRSPHYNPTGNRIAVNAPNGGIQVISIG